MDGEASSMTGSLLGRVLDRVTRPPVLTVFAILQAVLLAILVAGHMASRTDPAVTPEEPGTGDFAAFFTGAAMVRSGQGADLYDFGAQRAVQDARLGEGRGYWQHYLNPPALALSLAPTTGLGYVASFRLFAGVLFFLLLASLLYLDRATPHLGRSRRSTLTAVLLTLAYLPVALTTFGGQNTALTLALLCGIYAATRLRHPVVAGVLLGLLTYKPQFVLVVGLVFLLQRQFTTVAVAAFVGLLHYALGALVCGFGWPVEYMAALAEHGPIEMAENGVWHFSIPAVVGRWASGWVGRAVTIAGILAVLGLLAGAARNLSVQSGRYPAFFGMVVAGTMLLAPHLQFYEVGILALPVWLGLETLLSGGPGPSVGLRVLLAAGYFTYPLWKLSEALPVQPFLLLLLAVFLWSRHLVVTSPRAY
jgi:hypothetical protein